MKRDTAMLKLCKLQERYFAVEMTKKCHALFCDQE